MNGLLHQIGSFFTKFKMPTLLGIGIIILGLGAGVVLVLQNQTLTTQASPAQEPQNITVADIDDQSVAASWQTGSLATGFVTYGQNSPSEQTALDVHDTTTTTARVDHFVKITKLAPKTTYQFKIVSGKLSSAVQKFTTAASVTTQNPLPPIIGSVLDGDKSITSGIAYLTIPGASLQSAPISTLGSFTLPLARVYTNDLSDILPLSENSVVTLRVVSGSSQATANFTLGVAKNPLSPIKLGENVVLAAPTSTLKPDKDLIKYDLNGDNYINAADYSEVVNNFGKNPKNEQSSASHQKADLNGDGLVDRKDLDLMAQKIRERGGTI